MTPLGMLQRTREERIKWFTDMAMSDPVHHIPFGNCITFDFPKVGFSAYAAPGLEGWEYLGRTYNDYKELVDVIAVLYANAVEAYNEYESMFV